VVDWGINIEKSEGVGSGEGLCPPQFWVWGLAPRKKNQFCAKNYAILSKCWYFFPILQHKVGGIIPSVLKVGDLSPCLPCSDAYARETSHTTKRKPLVVMAYPGRARRRRRCRRRRRWCWDCRWLRTRRSCWSSSASCSWPRRSTARPRPRRARRAGTAPGSRAPPSSCSTGSPRAPACAQSSSPPHRYQCRKKPRFLNKIIEVFYRFFFKLFVSRNSSVVP